MLKVVLLMALFGASEQSRSVVLSGVVRDADGGVLPAATIELRAAHASSEVAVTSTDSTGQFTIRAEPGTAYDLRVSLGGFEPSGQRITVAGADTAPMAITLTMARLDEVVVVRGRGDVSEPSGVSHTAVTPETLETLPTPGVSSGLNAVVTLTAPAVAADSNGVFHPLGEHAETSFVVDGQPISDQQSRIFSNQVSPQIVQSLELSTGVPPAEFGDKTSLVAVVTTRSGLGVGRTAGTASVGYQSFRTPSTSLSLGTGTRRFGNYLAVDATTSDRFLDTPQVTPLHARGWMANFFDRADLQVTANTRVQANVVAARSQFLTPNTYIQQDANQDQQQRQHTMNIAASVQHVAGPRTVISAGAWWRHDNVRYDGSDDMFADRPATLGQVRRLTNGGVRATASHTTGRHVFKVGMYGTTTWLAERFHTGITDAAFNAPCLDAQGIAAVSSPLEGSRECGDAGLQMNPSYLPALRAFDLTRDGSLFNFTGTARVQQWAAYAQDVVTFGPWTVSVGMRLDVYRGLSADTALQPRLGITRRMSRTGTIWRVAYGRVMATPYNENLVLASSTGAGGFGGGAPGSVGGAPLTTARRHQYHAGVVQPLWRGIVVDGDYFWKRTDGPFDFNVILNTPLTVPVQFRLSKIDGGFARVTLPNLHGFQLSTTMSHTRSRLFGPSIGGLRFSANYAPVARPDHDQALQQTTRLDYRTDRFGGLWAGLTWRYDSGLVAVAVRSLTDAFALNGDDQAAMGLFCGATFASVHQPIRACDEQAGATRLRIPAPGTEDDDRNPPRLAPRHLVDVAAGANEVRLGALPLRLRVTVVNVFNTVALYNFLSTFSGTHFVTPRAVSAELGIRF